jgi:hypothetical protein
MQLLANRLALQVGHDVVQLAVRVAGIEERQNVRVLQACRGLDLDHKPLGAEHGGELRFQNFDGDLAIVLDIVRDIHGRHSACAELSLEAVAIGKGAAQSVERA